MRPENFENYSSDLRPEVDRTILFRGNDCHGRDQEAYLQFESAYGSTNSCHPYATGKWRADLVGHRKWDVEIIAELQRRFAPLSREQSSHHIP